MSYNNSNIKCSLNYKYYHYIQLKTILLFPMDIKKYFIKNLISNCNKIFLFLFLFTIWFKLPFIKLPSSIKSIIPNFMFFDKTKKLKILKSDLNNNVSIFKANKKVFKSIFTFNKYKKTFWFSSNFFIIQIITIKYCQLFSLYFSNIYARITQIFWIINCEK